MRTAVWGRAMVGAAAAAGALLAAAPAHALTPPARIAGVATHPWRLEARSVSPLVGFESPFARERTFLTMRRAGIGYARVDLRWKDVEAKGRGVRDWSSFDVLANAARRNHVRLLPMVAYTPAWASGDGNSFSFPRHASDFQRFMTAAIERYPQIKAWEIWNEPNYARFARPRPDPAGFVRLLRAAYRARAAARSHAKLISGGLAPDGEIPVPRFFDAMARLGGFKYVDGFGVHPYSGAAPDRPRSFFLTLPLLRKRLVEIGRPEVGIWATEYGYAAERTRAGEQEQGRRLATAYAIAAGWPWLRNLTWYGMRDDCADAGNPECRYGLVREDFSPKPAYRAFEQVLDGRLPRIQSQLALRVVRVGRGRRRRYSIDGSAFTPGTSASGDWITLRLVRRRGHRVRRRRTFTRLAGGRYGLRLGRLRPGRWSVSAEFGGTRRYLPASAPPFRFRVPRLRHRARHR